MATLDVEALKRNQICKEHSCNLFLQKCKQFCVKAHLVEFGQKCAKASKDEERCTIRSQVQYVYVVGEKPL